MDAILKDSIDLLNEIGAKQSTSEEIKALMEQGVTANVIKSVQRGIASGTVSVSINKINPAKSFVIINPYKMAQTNTTPAWSGDGVICEQVNETSLNFTCIATNGQFVWQVIEFA